MTDSATDKGIDRRAEVAALLGLHPFDRSSWPMDIIDRVIYKAEAAYQKSIRDSARSLVGANF